MPMLAGVEFSEVRDALRREREALVGSRAKLEQKSGVAESTIYRIETEETYVPRVPVLMRIIEGMGLTLSEFFARIEALTEIKDGNNNQPPRAESRTKGADDGRSLSAADRAADAYVQREFVTALAEEIVGAVDRLVDARAADRPATHEKPARSRRAGSSR